MKVGEIYCGYEILHNALSASEYRFEAKAEKGQKRILGSSLLSLKNNIDGWLAQVAMAKAWEEAPNRSDQLLACLNMEADDEGAFEKVQELERHLAMVLHVERITDYMHFTPTSTGITPCCRKDMIGDGERQQTLDQWAQAPNITGCPFCHRTWCD